MDIDQMMVMASKYAEDAAFYRDALKHAKDDVDPVNNPAHYADKEIEVIDYIDDTIPDCYSFYFGNALKYLSRHLNKSNAKQDLEKCKWYIDRMIKDLED